MSCQKTSVIQIGGFLFVRNKQKVLGIIAEYNPFHYGHDYQLKELKKRSQADCVIVLMSGNIVQRGEFAIVDKWARAEAALKSGADLVIESPLFITLQSADYFAQYSVQLLQKLGVTIFGFGTESATLLMLNHYVDWLDSHEIYLNAMIKNKLQEGYSYAASYQQAIEEKGASIPFDTSQPNHLLAVQYVKHNYQLSQPMQMIALQRLQKKDNVDLKSGSHIREKLLVENNKEPLDTFVPEVMAYHLKEPQLMSWQKAYPFLNYQLSLNEPESLQTIWGMREGLEHLFIRQHHLTDSWDDYLNKLTSKRWTKASIQRVLMAILLQVTTEDINRALDQFYTAPSAFVLGFTERGQVHLNELKKQSSINLVSNMNQQVSSAFHLTLKADRVFQSIDPQHNKEQNFTRKPIILK